MCAFYSDECVKSDKGAKKWKWDRFLLCIALNTLRRTTRRTVAGILIFCPEIMRPFFSLSDRILREWSILVLYTNQSQFLVENGKNWFLFLQNLYVSELNVCLFRRKKCFRGFGQILVIPAIVRRLSGGGAQLRENWLDFHQDPKEEINCPRSYFHRFSHQSKDMPLLEFLRYLSDVWF